MEALEDGCYLPAVYSLRATRIDRRSVLFVEILMISPVIMKAQTK